MLSAFSLIVTLMEKYNVTRNYGCLFWVFVGRIYSYRLLYSNKQTLCSAFACTRFKIDATSLVLKRFQTVVTDDITLVTRRRRP